MTKKILVIDDERLIVRLAQVNLEGADYDVVTALSGKEGLEKVDTEKPDLIVLSAVLPDMAGIDVLKNVRRDPVTRELPVILLIKEKRADRDVFQGWHSGLDCYLVKPLNPLELISFVRRIFATQDGSEVNTAVPIPSPGNSAQPVSWWRKMEEVWRKIGF